MVTLGFFRIVCLSACFILTAADEDLVITPSRLVVEYGAKASANCTTPHNHQGMGWEATEGSIDMVQNVHFLTWTVQSLTVWDIKPECFINLARKQSVKKLQITVYKLPDTLSINSLPPVIEDERRYLQCDVQNVAPVQYLKVTWYKQQSPVKSFSFNESTITPVNVSSELMIKPSREDDRAKYWCEAKLELGPDGPQPPPTMTSDPIHIKVYYKPMFSNDTEIIEAGDGNIMLNCTDTANPPSVYTWEGLHLEGKKEVKLSSLSVSYPGNYTCTASNAYGKAKKLFIIKSKNHNYTTLIAVLVPGLLLAVLLIAGYWFKFRKTATGGSANHSTAPSPSAQKEEGQELVSAAI
ncbi:hypothetical protein KOW79_019175 [Hemibagrus wyckioides]|uniref:Ig-like domain-containing protein n=1 Tax=Hemibagrus wyckioides TaxID=337641 RepID=A0A9D3N9K9_9TELE|nr:uncharacterized protein LOC131345430 [Hemibagrus wyckioides]KAG7316877.1 hypothetical protein KOW79_019175 [Hemibagrus wyckioides]